MKHLLSVTALLALAACGGGGGGTDGAGTPGTTPATPSSSTGLSIRFDKSSLNFDYNEGDGPPAQVVTATASGNTEKDVLMGAEVSGNGIQTPIGIAVDRAARTATITVVPQRALAAGSYTGTIRMLACADQACAAHHAGSPYTVSYTITVRPGLKPSATSLALAAAETGRSEITTISFTPPAEGAAVSAAVSYLNGQSGWLDARIVGTSLQVQASAGTLGAGTYAASVLLSAPSSGQTVTIPVRLTVGSGLTVPETASIKVDSAATAHQLQGTVALALAPGATATRWSAASNQPWLRVAQASGGFDTQPAWTIDTAAFGALANNAHHVAEITIGTDSNLPARKFKLDAHKALAEIKGLDAVALLAGEGGDVLVYGSGFSRLPAGLAGISAVGAQPSAVTVLGDGVLRLTMPAMRAGTYAVAARSASGVGTAARNLVVTAAGTYAYQALDTEGEKAAVVWDAVSKSAFVVNKALKSVMRYAEVNGRFQLVTTRSFPAVDSIAMTPDRSALVLQSNDSMLHKLSPTTLATIASFNLGALGGTAAYRNEPLTILGDNRLMHPLWGWIDLDTGAATPLRFEQAGYAPGAPAEWGIVSGNGLRMIRPDSGRYSPRGPIYRTDVLTGGVFRAYDSTMTPYFYRAAANHDGSVWALEDAVVDFDLNLRGQVALPDGWYGNRSALSRDGTRLYRYAENSYTDDKPRVYVIDTSKTMATSANLPVLGYIELADSPGCTYKWNTAGDCAAFGTKIAISDDGKALFLAGDRKFVVQPIPASLAPGVRTTSGAAARVLMQGGRR